jgi:hypothetical protein
MKYQQSEAKQIERLTKKRAKIKHNDTFAAFAAFAV